MYNYLSLLFDFGEYPQSNNRDRSCPMCMHAGSPLQKNAPIFGNVFTVTCTICNNEYSLLKNTTYY